MEVKAIRETGETQHMRIKGHLRKEKSACQKLNLGGGKDPKKKRFLGSVLRINTNRGEGKEAGLGRGRH